MLALAWNATLVFERQCTAGSDGRQDGQDQSRRRRTVVIERERAAFRTVAELAEVDKGSSGITRRAGRFGAMQWKMQRRTD